MYYEIFRSKNFKSSLKACINASLIEWTKFSVSNIPFDTFSVHQLLGNAKLCSGLITK